VPDRRLIYTDPATGLPIEILSEIEVWGFGTLAQRPAAGSEPGDLFWLIDGGAVRPQVWDGGAWLEISASPFGSAGGALSGNYPAPTLNEAAVPGAVFGKEIHRASRLDDLFTTGTTFVDHLDFDFTVAEAGQFLILAQITVGGDNNQTRVEGLISLDGIPFAGGAVRPGAGALGEVTYTEILDVALAVGPHNLLSQFRRVTGAGTASCLRSRFFLWRAD